MDPDFDRLLDDAARHDFSGWDFSFLGDRVRMEPSPWDYETEVRRVFAGAPTVLDLGTGGGEFLASLAPLPELTVATEGYVPNVAVADARLRGVGAHVVWNEGDPDNVDQQIGEQGTLPFRDASFDSVIDRHEAFRPREVARVLRPGGTFVTQQIGNDNEAELNDLLGAGPPPRSPSLDQYVDQLAGVGLDVRRASEARPCKSFMDVGAVASYLLAVPWQTGGFSLDAFRDRLAAIHDRITVRGPLVIPTHRLFFHAVKR